MTVIAWDGTTLAADRQATSGYIKVATTKIVRCPMTGRLIGSAGGMANSQAMVNWILNGEDPAKFPPSQQDKEDWARVIIIEPDGSVFEYERTPQRLAMKPIDTNRHAIGIGREVALGALAMGADARTAVNIASIYVEGCGLGVDTLTLSTTDYGFHAEDIRIDTYTTNDIRQHPAVRITHLPTNIVVEYSSERSQHRNAELAKRKLREILDGQP